MLMILVQWILRMILNHLSMSPRSTIWPLYFWYRRLQLRIRKMTMIYIFCLSEGSCLSPRLLFFFISYPGIVVTSRMFWSSSVGLRVDFIFFHSSGLFIFPYWVYNQDIVVWKKFRKVRRSRCCWSSSSGSNPEWMNLYVCGSRTSQLTFWLCSLVLHSASRLRKEVLLICCDPRCCYRFRRNFSNRSTVPKKILLPGFVDLVDHIASSNLARLVTFSELSEPCPMPCTSSIGPIVVKKTACLPLLRLVPPGINPFLIIEFNSFAFPTW